MFRVFLVWLILCSPALAQSINLPPGTILVSRNRDESQNTTPGFWNHTAIVGNGDFIIESQAGIVERGQGKGVIITTSRDYFARDYAPIIALEPKSLAAGERAAVRAQDLVGLPFRQISSLFRVNGPRRQQMGINCLTATVEIPWGEESRQIRRNKIPDQVFKFDGDQFLTPVTIRER